jgi:hypothetical protein
MRVCFEKKCASDSIIHIYSFIWFWACFERSKSVYVCVCVISDNTEMIRNQKLFIVWNGIEGGEGKWNRPSNQIQYRPTKKKGYMQVRLQNLYAICKEAVYSCYNHTLHTSYIGSCYIYIICIFCSICPSVRLFALNFLLERATTL